MYWTINQDSQKYSNLSRISCAMILLYFVDIITLGTGEVGKIGFLSSRILFFMLAGIFSLPLLWQQRKFLIHNRYVLAVSVFLLWVGISAVRGVLMHNPRDHIQGDVLGFLNYMLLPTMLCVFGSTQRKKLLTMVIAGCCLAGNVIIFILSFYASFSADQQGLIYRYFVQNGFAGITQLDAKATRIFFHTLSRYLLIAYMIFLYKATIQDSPKKRIPWVVVMGFLMYGIFISYTRGIYAGCVIAVVISYVILVIKKNRYTTQFLNSVLSSVLVALVIIGSVSLYTHTNMIGTAVNRVMLAINTTDSQEVTGEAENHGNENSILSTEIHAGTNSALPTEAHAGTNSDYTDIAESSGEAEQLNLDERQEKLRLLKASIARSPIIGNGLGSSIALGDGRVEYSYYDVVNKMGIIGLILFLFPFVLELIDVFRMKKSNVRCDCRSALLRTLTVGSIAYFLVIAIFNPCMNTTLGISAYLFSMVLFQNSDFLCIEENK